MGPVRALAFSPSRPVLASASSDTTIRIWEVPSGKEIKALVSRFGAMRSVAFSPDGQLLASGGDDGSVRIWDWASGREIRSMRGRLGIVFAVAFSPDGVTLVTGASDALVHLWDLATGRERSALSGHQGPVHSVAFSPDGLALASGGADGVVRLWDLSAGRERRALSGHRGEVHSVAFAPDGRTVASAGADGTVRIWDIASASERAALSAHAGPAWSLAYSMDGALVASAGRDRVVRLQPPVPPTLGPALAEKIKQRGNEVGPPPPSPPFPEAALSIRPFEARAGDELTLRLTVTNKGKGPLYRFQARTRSREPAFDGHRFYLGKIEPGRRAEDTVSLTIPKDHADAAVDVQIEFEEHNGFVPDPLKALIAVKGLPRPRFAYIYQIIDDGTGTSVGNGDGRIQKGEAVDLLIGVKNVGSVPAQRTWAQVTSPTLQGLGSLDARIDLGRMEPDETRNARVNLVVRKDLPVDEIPLRLFIRDEATSVMLDEAVKLSVDNRPAPQILATNKLVSVADVSANVHSGAGAETSVIASAAQHQALAVTGELGDWYRVQLSETDTGWVARRAVREVEGAAGAGKAEIPVPSVRGPAVVKVFQNAPPVLALASPSHGQQVTADRIQLTGAAASGRGIARVEIRVNGQVVARRETRGVAVRGTGEGERTPTLEFSERLPLQEGSNEIVVTAFDHENLSSTRTVTVTRLVDRGQIWAVVVGISQYRAVRSLRYADKDALAFYDYLIAQVGVPKGNVTLLTNDQATLFNLKRSLGTDLKRKAGQKDTVIIYYAGHGAPETDATSPDEDGLEKYLVPYDADPNDLYTTALPMREVETIFQRLASDRVIFITDSCYSGATAGRTFATASRRAVVSDAFLARLSKGKGRVVLTASRASEVSEERETLGHGVFTYYLLEGLRGKADLDGDGVITVDEAYTYVSKKVPEVTGQNQNPVKKGEVEGQLILGRVH
jgi:hypothetical protein